MIRKMRDIFARLLGPCFFGHDWVLQKDEYISHLMWDLRHPFDKFPTPKYQNAYGKVVKKTCLRCGKVYDTYTPMKKEIKAYIDETRERYRAVSKDSQ